MREVTIKVKVDEPTGLVPMPGGIHPSAAEGEAVQAIAAAYGCVNGNAAVKVLLGLVGDALNANAHGPTRTDTDEGK